MLTSTNVIGDSSVRAWKRAALWSFRDFNELPHAFEKRIKMAYLCSDLYVSSYSHRIVGTVSAALCYMLGALAALIVLLSCIDEDILLYIHFLQHNLLWHVGTLTLVYAFLRTQTKEFRTKSYSSTQLMEQIVAHIHFAPPHWLRSPDSNAVKSEVATLFPLKIMLFIGEVVDIVVAPYLLIVVLPASLPAMLEYIRYTSMPSFSTMLNMSFLQEVHCEL